MLQSPSLALPHDENLEDCFDILKRAGPQGMAFELFVPFLRRLLMRVYAKGPHPGRVREGGEWEA